MRGRELERSLMQLAERQRSRQLQDESAWRRQMEQRVVALEARLEQDAIVTAAWRAALDGRVSALEDTMRSVEARCNQILAVSLGAVVAQVVLRLVGHG